jgi:hypothetical protein
MNYDLTFIHVQEDSRVSYPLKIYKDDTIDNVKSKLSQVLENKNVDEYYFFSKQKRRINPYDLYKKLSFQNTRIITYEIFYSFCINHELPCDSKKDSYELEDFLELELEKEVISTLPIGIIHDTPFVVNPFKNSFNQLEDSGTSSKSLWMPFSDLVDDTVYVCLASDVYSFSKKKGLEISKVFNVYYPYLFKEGKLEPSLFTKQDKSIYTDYNEIMDFHHSIYKPDTILSEGVTGLFFVMYTLQPFQFPLDIFFKLFHSTVRYPFIKLNGIKTNENMYRLYCNQISENGYKIPFLKKRNILKYAHEVNKNSISYLFYDKEVPLFLNLDKRGHLYVRLDQIPFFSIETVEELIKNAIGTFMKKLIEFFDPSQKIFTPFESLHQSNISILDMKYKATYKKEAKINIKKYMSCFSPLFNFMNEKDKIILRYKRVSNYNESQSKDAYLIESFNKNIPIEEIILVFSANFMKHDDKAAADYVHQFFSSIEIEEKQNNLKRVKINPGFLVEIDKKENIEVTVHSIDNIQYIPFIRLYITNMILISQGILSDNGKCKKIKEFVVKEIKPIRPVETIEEDFTMDDKMDEIDEPDEDLDIPVDFDNLSPPSDNLSPPSLSPSSDSLSPPSDSLSPPSLSGGSVSDEKLYDVFLYDENDPYSMKKKFKKEPLREARLIDYFRAFQGNECTLIKKENETCKGYVIVLTGTEFKQLLNGATPFFIDYLDKPGNSYSGITYARDPLEWPDHPTIEFVKKVYASVSYGWNHKQDDKDEMYIYDSYNELKARYNNKYYVKLDESEELTKIQFTPVNPLLKRLQDREPTLFTKTDKTHNQYSRMCLWSDKRQPVILSKEEKDRIDDIAPGSYESSIEYGTDLKKPYYYICPRYWDLKHNVPVNPENVDKDKLISRNSSDSDKQKHIQSRYILELAKPGDKPVYQTRVGFLTKKHPNGYYMPCCFMSKPKKDKPDAVDKRIEEALQYYKRKTEDVNEKVVDYIQNGDKFPLTENRKGHLTPILERFFNLKYSDCYSQLQKKKLKLNYPCLLRHGVKEEQPFLSALSFLYFKKNVPLDQFIQVILDKINLDNIQTFHNGGIVNTFSSDTSVDVSKYKETKLYRVMKDTLALKRIVSGYENFVKYLNSQDYIDYTYLWDIVTGILFKEKVNMIVLKEGLEDVTQNIQIVCPTTSHAIYTFHEKRSSILIYQKGDFFEPLYLYKKMDDKTDKTITMFDLKENIPSVHAILKKIHQNIDPSCKERTVHKSYQFKENLFLEELLDEVKKTSYKVLKQIMNIDGRIFGIMVKKDKNVPFFVPCRPSAVTAEYELLDDSLWQDYRMTVYCLNQLSEESKHKIPCKPKLRVLENELVVGILTETNQFVPLKEPEENKMKDELGILDEHRLHVEDTIQKGELGAKEKVIQHLKLEQMFYNAFFNTLKVELNDSANLSTRKRIEKAVHRKDKEMIEKLFEPILEDKFLFVDDYDVDLYSLTNINLCKNNEEPYCGKLEHEGKLMIPNENLFNQSDNSQGYKNRFIDDLMMNVHIQRILFEEIHSTLYYTDRYHLAENEILLLESDLNTYLDKEPIKRVNSVTYPLLEDVQPSRILEFVDKAEIKEEVEPVILSDSESDSESKVIPKVKTLSKSITPKVKTPEIPEKTPPVMSKVKTPEIPEETPNVMSKVKTPEIPEETPPVMSKVKTPEIPEKTPPVMSKVKTPEIPEKTPDSESDSDSDSEEDTPVVKLKSKKPLGTSLNALPQKVPQKSIAILSRKIAENKVTKSTEKAEEFVKSAKTIHQKTKTPESEKLLIDSQEHLQDLQPSKFKKIKRIHPDIIPCIKTFYFKKDSKWKDYFPPKTIGFRIMKGDTYETSIVDLKCNFIMALQILKDYDEKYTTLTIRELKEMLIKGYTHLSETVDTLEKKFKKEKKRFKKWSDILMESYPFTQLDLLVLMYEYKLPVVLFIQTKNNIHLITYHTNDTFKYYIKMKKKDVFMFFIYQHQFKIERKDMNALYDAERDIIYLSQSQQLEDFFKDY